MATTIANCSCSGMATSGVSTTSRVPTQSLELDIDDVESLVKDLMGVASQCMFGNDIHPLVDSIANRSLATITEDELLAISPRYGDIVYNMLSLRENYQCPVTDLICDPLLPHVLDRDHDSSEMEAALALAAVDSYKSVDKESEMAPSFLNQQQTSSQFLQVLPQTEECQSEPLLLSSSFPSGPLVTDVQPSPPSSTPPSLALGFGQPLGAAQSWPPCPYSFSSNANLPPWGQQQVSPLTNHAPSTRTGITSYGSSLASNMSPDAFTGRTHARHFSLHEPSHKHARRDDENHAPSPSLSHPSSSTLSHYCDSLASFRAGNDLPASQGQLSASKVGVTPNTPTSKPHSILSLRQLLQDKPVTTPSSAPLPNDREQLATSEHTHKRRHHHRRQPSRFYQQSISQQRSSSEEDSGHVGCHKKVQKKTKQQQQIFLDSNQPTQLPGPSSPSSCQIPHFPMMLFTLGSRNRNLVIQPLAGSPSSLTSIFPCQPPSSVHSSSSMERQSPCLVSSNTDTTPASLATGEAVDPGTELAVGSSSPLQKKERVSRRYAPHAGMKLWEFLLKVLVDAKYTDIIRWISKEEGTFRVINSEGLAQLWGEHKNRNEMNYDKLSRAMRYYYHKNLLDKAPKRLCYQFKYYSRWWEKLALADPQFQMASLPSPPPGSPPVMDNFE